MSLQAANLIARTLGPEKFQKFQQLRKLVMLAPKTGDVSSKVASLELTGAEYIQLAKTLGIPVEALKKLGDISGNINIAIKRFSPERFLLRYASNLHNSKGVVEKATASVANGATGAVVKVNSCGANGSNIVANSYIPKNNLQEWFRNISDNMRFSQNGTMAEVTVAAPKTTLNMSVPMEEIRNCKPVVDGLKTVVFS